MAKKVFTPKTRAKKASSHQNWLDALRPDQSSSLSRTDHPQEAMAANGKPPIAIRLNSVFHTENQGFIGTLYR